jgi:hypothetical protein
MHDSEYSFQIADVEMPVIPGLEVVAEQRSKGVMELPPQSPQKD